MIQRILALAAGFLVVVAIGGWGHEVRTTSPGQPQAAQAIRAVTTNQPNAAGQLPTDFRAVMGYLPTVVPNGPTRADGGCSSPFGGTRYHFTADCRQHDLGYDLLRYANAKGQPLGAWARRAVDDRFAAQTRSRCDGFACWIAADFYTAVVKFNSWRQGYGTPVAESKGRLFLPVAAGIGTALLLGLLPLPRRRPQPRIRPLATSVTNLKHPYRWLIAAAMLGLAVYPVLLPHASWVQVVIGAAAGAQGYALAALCTLLGQRLLGQRLLGQRLFGPLDDRRAIPTPKPAVTGGLGAAILGAATLTAHAGQLATAARTGMPQPTLLADALAVAGAALAGTAVIGLGIGMGIAVRAGFGMFVRLLRRVPRQVAALVLAPVLVLTGSTAASAESSQHLVSTRSVSALSAGTSSLNSTLGTKGEEFLKDRPTASTIGAVTGRPAQTPVRVYVGRDAATTPQARAALAVRELDRTGGFRRAAVLISVPTGSGWVNPAAGSALEYLYGGDIATVVVQYAADPSWVAYLRGGEGVQASTRALTDAIRARLDRIPANQRPRLLAYGESLGAWGGLRAYDGDQGLGMAQRTDGALWAGIPGSKPDRSPNGTRTLVHSDDPVPAWSLPLMLHESPTWPARWLPVVSFWQATGDVISALEVPSGFGHRYGSELVDAWRPLISTTDVPGAAPPDRLNAVRAAIG